MNNIQLRTYGPSRLTPLALPPVQADNYLPLSDNIIEWRDRHVAYLGNAVRIVSDLDLRDLNVHIWDSPSISSKNNDSTIIRKSETIFERTKFTWMRAIDFIEPTLAIAKSIEQTIDVFTESDRVDKVAKSRKDALADLAELASVAEEEGLPAPASDADKTAREIIELLATESPRDYLTSLWEDGDIVVYTGNRDSRVNIYCRANGGISFYITSPSHLYEKHYSYVDRLLMRPVIEAIKNISE